MPQQPVPTDWQAAEAALNVRLPADFKAHAETAGPAYVGEFFYTCVPGHPNPNVDFVENARAVSGALGTLRAHHPEVYTAPVFPEAGGFLAFGRTDNGDYLGWMARDPDPATWPAAVWGDEDGEPQVFEGIGFSQLIDAITHGTLRPAAFPEGLWARVPMTSKRID